MRSLAAGPDGVLLPNTAVDLPDAQAAELIAGGYADDLAQPEAAIDTAEETAEAGATEAATAGPAEQRA